MPDRHNPREWPHPPVTMTACPLVMDVRFAFPTRSSLPDQANDGAGASTVAGGRKRPTGGASG
jgi:hypothetical protein